MTFGGNHCYCFITIYYDLGVITICLLRHTNTSTWSNRAYSFSGSFTITWVGCLYAWLVFNWCLSQIGSLFIYFYWIMTSRNIKGTPHTHHQDKLLKGMEKGVMVMDMVSKSLSPNHPSRTFKWSPSCWASNWDNHINAVHSWQILYWSFMPYNKMIDGKWHEQTECMWYKGEENWKKKFCLALWILIIATTQPTTQNNLKQLLLGWLYYR